MNTTPYLFLDVDGPLNNHQTHMNMIEQFPNSKEMKSGLSSDLIFEMHGLLYLIDMHMLNNLYTIVKEFPNLKIIGISSWFSPKVEMCRGRRVFKDLTGLEVEDVIESTAGGVGRYDYVQKYVEARCIKRYAIIDDIPYNHPNLVQILSEGLTEALANDTIRILKDGRI